MIRPDQGLSLSRHRGRVGEDPGNEVEFYHFIELINSQIIHMGHTSN